MRPVSYYLTAFGIGFAAAGLMLIAVVWIAPGTPAVSNTTRDGHESAVTATRESPQPILLDYCQRRTDALIETYPLTFSRRSSELEPESRPLIYGVAEISADCPDAAVRIELGDDGDLASTRRNAVAARLRALGVPVAGAVPSAGQPTLRFVPRSPNARR